MKTACGCGCVRLILACFLGISFASPIDAGLNHSNQKILLPRQGGMVWATFYPSTDPIQYRIKKTGRTFISEDLQPDGLSSTLGRFKRHRPHAWILGNTEKKPLARFYSPDLHGRAPPSR